MSQSIAYLNGEFLPEHQLLIDPRDAGFVQGVTVAEQLRTFDGVPFLWTPHRDRLRHGLRVLGLDEPNWDELEAAIRKLARHNHALLEPGDDLGITLFVTPGLYSAYRSDGVTTNQIGIHSHPLPFSLWSSKYAVGQRCRISQVHQIDERSWPRSLKCRSRAHYYLADRQAQAEDPGARAILLDSDGNINEASTANVVAYFPTEGIVSPPRDAILPGVSLGFVESITETIGLRIVFRPLPPEELMEAQEVMLTSSPFCVLPVASVDDRVYDSREVSHAVIAEWSRRAGVDIAAQAQRFAQR